MQRLTEYYDGEARAIRIDHKKAFAKLAAYEDTELTPEEVAELKLELLATRNRLVDVEKILERVYEFFNNEWDCPMEFDDELAINICLKDYCEYPGQIIGCWEKYWALKARKGDETSQIQNRK